jgi:molybdopterin converting factor small subunit
MLEALQSQKSETVTDDVASKIEQETKSVVDKLKEKIESIAGEYLEATGKEIVGFLDNMKLPIGDGETIDILPGLGTFLGKELTDLTDSVKDLASDKSDAMPQNVSMVTQNNIGANKSAPIAFPSPVVRDTDPAVALYKTRAALV